MLQNIHSIDQLTQKAKSPLFNLLLKKRANKSEIGALVPNDASQILGYTTVTLLVIPSEKIVAVRAFNSFGNPEGYDYLKDVRAFGDAVMLDLL